jgi:molybdate transport repressor ModE-like protein
VDNVVSKKIPLSLINIEVQNEGVLDIQSPLEDALTILKDSGSLKRTANELGVSYTYLWNSLRALGELEGKPLFEGKRGGVSGGGAKLTSTGEELIGKSKTLKKRIRNAVKLLEDEEISSLDLTIIGSQCTGLKVLIDLIKKKIPDFKAKVLHTGSLNGVDAIQRGDSDIAGVHLLDGVTGNYNHSFLKSGKLSKDVILARGYLRAQGLFVKRGNPKGIQNLKDLLIGDIVFINRNKGSGTRILLDTQLSQIANQRRIKLEDLLKKIKGYQNEVTSSIEVADAVSRSIADTGFGIEAEANKHSLDFIPLAMENYDFIIRKDRLKNRGVRIFLETLRSEEYRDLLRKKTIGIRPTTQTGIILSAVNH